MPPERTESPCGALLFGVVPIYQEANYALWNPHKHWLKTTCFSWSNHLRDAKRGTVEPRSVRAPVQPSSMPRVPDAGSVDRTEGASTVQTPPATTVRPDRAGFDAGTVPLQTCHLRARRESAARPPKRRKRRAGVFQHTENKDNALSGDSGGREYIERKITKKRSKDQSPKSNLHTHTAFPDTTNERS